MLAARRDLVKDRTAALNRGQNLTLPLLTRQNQQHLKQIEAQINDIDREQAALVAKQQSLKARFDILLSIPGLGAVSVLAMLINMPELGSLRPSRPPAWTDWHRSPASPAVGRAKAASRVDARLCDRRCICPRWSPSASIHR